MHTKAELERQVRSLKLQLANALEGARGIPDDKAPEVAELRQRNETLSTQLHELQAQLESEQSARYAAEMALLEKQQALVEMEQETTLRVTQTTEQLRQDLESRHKREIKAQVELISMLRLQTHTRSTHTSDESTGRINNDPPPSSDGRGLDTHHEGLQQMSLNSAHHGSETDNSPRTGGPIQQISLPPLATFDGKEHDNGNAFDRWSRKLRRYAELQKWTDRDTLLQLELHLTGRAEEIYEVLPETVKRSPDSAMSALRERLHPVRNDALVSAQLMRRRQEPQETVDTYAQAFEQLFGKSYGRHQGMDVTSRATLKRDLFVQGLLLKWQEKVLPSAETFEDALLPCSRHVLQKNSSGI